ncbi:MAG: pyruvate kinase [bacterium]
MIVKPQGFCYALNMRKTKIICTIGPATNSEAMLKKLVTAGMDICRLNLSHGTLAEHEEVIRKIRKIDPKIRVLADLQGPRIRTGKLKNQNVKLKLKEFIDVYSREIIGDETKISISPATVFADIKVGDILLLADGTIQLKVLTKDEQKLHCEIEDGGTLGEHKGVNIPKTKLSLPSLTEKDRQDAAWACSQGVDYIALSFVREAKDLLTLRELLKCKIPIIAKIEKPEAVENIKEIIKAADAIMIARGDLGIEMRLEKVPETQKMIVKLCHEYKKPVIVATQMLPSMVTNELPSRAEVSDVANAIFDGTDAVMLSEETSIGEYPVETVETMARIALEAEDEVDYEPKAF